MHHKARGGTGWVLAPDINCWLSSCQLCKILPLLSSPRARAHKKGSRFAAAQFHNFNQFLLAGFFLFSRHLNAASFGRTVAIHQSGEVL